MNNRRDNYLSVIWESTHSTISFWSGMIAMVCAMAVAFEQIARSPTSPSFRMLAILWGRTLAVIAVLMPILVTISWSFVWAYRKWRSD